ncbi:excinuclease ABC subunit UvrC [Caloramator proteoclasticus]|uniref:UvrABC system protein C n=1 Tax=Caloramator proteoclasticus DSM 10124 TaxID=1121262 RepID=A0A1M4VBP6_9CLOT|nr:excinuclease ABC subunit UvrC [Caloramator proteoclasticus]SHE66347.1 Excinuclease ABC subunit C [Caloramator proteoclasticus DSM 10124]
MFEERLKNLPEQPGVYIMKNELGEIIYVGKAINLKNRVRQYFKGGNHPPKVRVMVSNISDFEYIITNSELEALILECNLIKKYKPKYNILLKDDKQYPFIKVTLNEEYPRVFVTRRYEKDGSKYFGPFTDVSAVKETINLIRKLFKLRTCRKSLKYGVEVDRPCLNYHINRCLAPCTGKVDVIEYRQIIDEVIKLLQGKYDELIKILEEKMYDESSKLNFEKAAEYRDQINSIKKIQEKQRIISSYLEDEDVIAYAKDDEGMSFEVFFIRNGKLLGRENFYFEDVNEDAVSQFIVQFYEEREFIPKEILLSNEIPEVNIIESYLTSKRGSKVTVKVPKRGEKSEIIELAKKNAYEALRNIRNKIQEEKLKTEFVLYELKRVLDLDILPKRIEAYDISNIQGTDSVGGMVVFENGKPNKKQYRRFKIKTVIGADDFNSMAEIVERRFKRGLKEIKNLLDGENGLEDGKFSIFPDLILLDGGELQVKAVKRVLEEMGLVIPICGMVKDDKHKTKALFYEGREIVLDRHSYLYRFISAVQEEVHRFAISYHRGLKAKNTLSSILDDIPEIGKKRKMALLKHFNSIEEIKKASIDELLKVDGMNEKAALSIYNYFNNNNL